MPVRALAAAHSDRYARKTAVSAHWPTRAAPAVAVAATASGRQRRRQHRHLLHEAPFGATMQPVHAKACDCALLTGNAVQTTRGPDSNATNAMQTTRGPDSKRQQLQCRPHEGLARNGRLASKRRRPGRGKPLSRHISPLREQSRQRCTASSCQHLGTNS